MRRRPLLAALAFLVPACSSTPNDGPAQREPEASPAPPQPVAAPGAAQPETARSVSGATVLGMPAAAGLEPVAEICLCLPAGRDHGLPGLAELALEALVAATEDGSGNPALRRTLLDLGGSLETDVGDRRSWVYLRVPPAHCQTALAALARALAEPVTSRARLDRVRSGMLEERARSLYGEKAHLAVAEALMLGKGGPAEVLEALQERDPAEILLFHRRHFRPPGSFVAVAVPNGDPGSVARIAAAALDGWTAAAAQQAVPAASEPLPSAIHWIPGEGPCKAVLMFGLPDPLDGRAANQWVLQECLTMEGVGGRLERALIDSGSPHSFASEILTAGTRDWLALTAAIEPAQVPRLWRVADAARASLAAVGPSRSERSLGERRARLGLLSQRRTPLRRLQLAIRRTAEGLARDPLGKQLERLADPDHDPAAAATSWLGLPFSMVVVGGRPNEADPADADRIVEHRPAAGRAAAGVADADPRARIEDARPHLERALQALGGPHKVGAVRGYRQVAELRMAGGPAAVERIELDGGTLERSRTVLGTTVRAVVEEGSGTESAGDARSELEPRRVAELLLEANRHPLMLLAAHAQGRLLLQLVSVRLAGDREVAVLEAVHSPYTRLRIHLDVRSGLPRVVESWRQGGEGPLYLREVYSDFRQTGGIRVPFHRLTDVDVGSWRLETVVSEFEPIRR